MFIAFLVTFIAGLCIGIVATCIIVALRLERNPKMYIVNFSWSVGMSAEYTDSVYISNTPTPDSPTLVNYVRREYPSQTNGKAVIVYIKSAYPLR